jgi:hypothetical protein
MQAGRERLRRGWPREEKQPFLHRKGRRELGKERMPERREAPAADREIGTAENPAPNAPG